METIVSTNKGHLRPSIIRRLSRHITRTLCYDTYDSFKPFKTLYSHSKPSTAIQDYHYAKPCTTIQNSLRPSKTPTTIPKPVQPSRTRYGHPRQSAMAIHDSLRPFCNKTFYNYPKQCTAIKDSQLPSRTLWADFLNAVYFRRGLTFLALGWPPSIKSLVIPRVYVRPRLK